MKKIFLLTIFIICTAYTPTPSIALDAGTSWNIVNNFKTKHEQILFETLPLSQTGANEIIETEYRINGLEALKNKLQQMENFYAEKKETTTQKRLNLENTIQLLDNAIKKTEEWIANTKAIINEKKIKIKALDKQSYNLRKKIISHRKVILEYISNIYSEWNLIFDAYGEVDIMKTLILTEKDTSYYLSDMTYKSILSQLWQKLIEDHHDMIRQLYIASIKTDEEKTSLEESEKQLQKQEKELKNQKEEKEKILEITKWKEELYKHYVLSQQQAKQQVADAWKKANQDYQKSFDNFMKQHNCEGKTWKPECIRLRQFFINEKELAKSEYKTWTDNIFVWPTKSRRVTAYFRDGEYYKLVGSHHDAIDIGTPQWSDVYSAADGYVYYIVEPTPTSYSYVAIRHKNWLVTVYGHLSEVLVAPYQFVRQWDIIAKSWWAPGTAGAGPVTTGAHLHFETWKEKEATDPLRFLSLTEIEYSKLPALYQKKFINDIIEKNGSDADTSQYKVRFVLKWETEEERQKYLLNTYATPPFRNWNLWTDVALSQKIDPSFLMCIGLSETTLGNNLKTAYNIGNVWNTDDGSTIAFSSPKEWIYKMAKTFNNQFLWKYTKISQLSRWWNQTWPIYASSASNWHDNSIRCLSAIKGRFVEDNYNFRITP